METKVSTLEKTSLFIKGGLKTMALLGAVISGAMLFCYHFAVVFFPHRG